MSCDGRPTFAIDLLPTLNLAPGELNLTLHASLDVGQRLLVTLTKYFCFVALLYSTILSSYNSHHVKENVCYLQSL